ncbi:MAG: helix-turn-helix transcriptional regulator [Burkholderia sp.]|jgi:transcriptional regulator with XRE-family HTH domain
MHSVEALIRHRVAQVSQDAVAEKAGMKPCTVSRILSGNQGVPLERLGDFLRALGLDVWSQEGDDVRISRAKLDALRLLAKDALEAGE